jgi:RimJ/RimL family protein N-acetyltransferase
MEHMWKPLTESETADFIERAQAHFKEHGFGLFACVRKDTSELIGFVGLNIPPWEAPFTPCVEIGWRLAYDAWDQGYATEAARAVLKAGFERFGLKEIVSFTVPKNKRSIRVMERLGMVRDLKGDFHHPRVPLDHPLSLHVLYRMTKERYQDVYSALREA